MPAYPIKEFAEPKMEIIYWALATMLTIEQLDRVCLNLMQRDERERAERESMRHKVGL